MTDLFYFHGLESTPHGFKYHALAEDFDIESPDFQDMKIWERLEKAEAITEGMKDIVVVGSSFGGLLAALLYDRHPERFDGYVLLAPALHRDEVVGEIDRMPEPDRATVIHGIHDDVVPIDEVEAFCEEFGIEVTRVDDNHRLHDSIQPVKDALRRMGIE